jgi:primosomal protein N' (replication factor Y) (superfamily II helicase)
MNTYYRCAINSPFNGSILTYSSKEQREIGEIIEVPLGSRTILGCVIEITSDIDFEPNKLKNLGTVKYDFSLEKDFLKFLHWVSDYYHYPLGPLIFETLPKEMKKPRELVPIMGSSNNEIPLNSDQLNAVDTIKSKSGFHRWLLHGVTGSGKSNVYLSVIQETLRKGRSVLFLLPEINLTHQFIEMFSKTLQSEIYIYNSSVSNSEKLGLWNLLSNNNKSVVVIGVRSAIFLPFMNLGLIIVDEEHDNSFKQDDRCAYNARDIAIKRAKDLDIPIILGSATPSMEMYYQVSGTPEYLTLKSMALSAQRPVISLIDIRKKESNNQEIWPFQESTVQKINLALEKKEQVLIFLNKLGYADFIQCSTCGHHFHCPNCSSNLKFYKFQKKVSCQICGYEDKSPEICPTCGNMNLRQVGYGTEKLTEVLSAYFPKHKVDRFDRDELKTPKSVERKLKEFHDGQIDILVGTQMLSKGHNFKRVNLVVVMGVDAQLNFPDHRATERAYQLITQVSGRPGRFGADSEVLIQTLNSDNALFKIIQEHSFSDFYQEEISIRKLCSSPPFSRLAMIYLTGTKQGEVAESAVNAARQIRHMINEHFKNIELLGPRPAIIEKRVNKYSWTIMLKSSDRVQLHHCVNTFKGLTSSFKKITFKFDIDPYHML